MIKRVRVISKDGLLQEFDTLMYGKTAQSHSCDKVALVSLRARGEEPLPFIEALETVSVIEYTEGEDWAEENKPCLDAIVSFIETVHAAKENYLLVAQCDTADRSYGSVVGEYAIRRADMAGSEFIDLNPLIRLNPGMRQALLPMLTRSLNDGRKHREVAHV